MKITQSIFKIVIFIIILLLSLISFSNSSKTTSNKEDYNIIENIPKNNDIIKIRYNNSIVSSNSNSNDSILIKIINNVYIEITKLSKTKEIKERRDDLFFKYYDNNENNSYLENKSLLEVTISSFLDKNNQLSQLNKEDMNIIFTNYQLIYEYNEIHKHRHSLFSFTLVINELNKEFKLDNYTWYLYNIKDNSELRDLKELNIMEYVITKPLLSNTSISINSSTKIQPSLLRNDKCDFDIMINKEKFYHNEFIVKSKTSMSNDNDNNDIYIDMKLTEDMFIEKFDVEEGLRKKGYVLKSIYYNDKIDQEVSSDISSQYLVNLVIKKDNSYSKSNNISDYKKDNNDEFIINFHLRYQPPSEIDYTKVLVKYPKICYINSGENNNDKNKNRDLLNEIMQQYYTIVDNSKIDYVYIPTGQNRYINIISIITIFITFLFLLVVIVEIHSKVNEYSHSHIE